MTNTTVLQSSLPRDFSTFERSLVEKTEVAISDGVELERWTRDPNRVIEKHRLNLNRTYELRNEAIVSGDVVVTGTGVGPRTVQLRADRNGKGSGRIYTITARATNAGGLVTTATATCTVPHDQGK